MNTFSQNLKEFMEESGTSVKDLQIYLQFSTPSSIYFWLKGRRSPSLKTAVKLADYFHCSLDFLFGLSEDDKKDFSFRQSQPFGKQLEKILTEKKISKNKLHTDLNLSRALLHKWFHAGCIPNIQTAIYLAEYLNISLDYLAGRE